MSVDGNSLPIRRLHEALPVAQRLESIMDKDNIVSLLRGAVWEAVELSIRLSARQRHKHIPNVAVRIVPVLTNSVQNSLSIVTSGPTEHNQCKAQQSILEYSYSFSGAMTGTTLLCPANMEAICLMIASVLATFVEFECQPGKDNLCPELSKLPRYNQRPYLEQV